MAGGSARAGVYYTVEKHVNVNEKRKIVKAKNKRRGWVKKAIACV